MGYFQSTESLHLLPLLNYARRAPLATNSVTLVLRAFSVNRRNLKLSEHVYPVVGVHGCLK